MGYTLHQELTDGTLEPSHWSTPNKRIALKVAKLSAKKSLAEDVARYIVCDCGEMTVAAFPCAQAEGR